jgi:dipeptidyl-peptidase-4
MRIVSLFVAVLGLMFASSPAFSQGTRAHYDRMKSVNERMRDTVFRDRVEPQWFANGTRCWYRVSTAANAYEFVLVDVVAGKRDLAFNHDAVAAHLSGELKRPVSASNLPITALSFETDHILIKAAGKLWRMSNDAKSWQRDEEDGAEISGFAIKPLKEPKRSGPASDETSIRFENRWNRQVSVYWVDRDGQRRHYGEVAPGADREQHTYAGHVWLVMDGERPLVLFEASRQAGIAIIDNEAVKAGVPNRRAGRTRRPNPAISPDGKWRAAIVDYNVELTNVADGEKVRLTDTGTEDDRFEGRFHWAPDGERLVVMQVEQAEEHDVHLIESAPTDQLQPKLHTFRYHKPGDKLPVPRPRLLDTVGRRVVELDESLFENAWSIDEVRWRPDSSRFTFLFNPRGHQALRVMAVERNGMVRAIVDERSETFIDYSYKKFTHYIDDTDELIWMSERDGWNHLYLIDQSNGNVKQQITQGEWVVRKVERVDIEQRQLWLQISGCFAGQDPYFVHLARVDFDGQNFAVLTEGDGSHDWTFSPAGRWFIDTWSRVDLPPITELRDSETGHRLCILEKADWSALLNNGWTAPERFVAKARDGQTDIHGIIIRPFDFDAQRKYPVIEEIYAGPHGSFVPKKFSRHSRQQQFAELGFVVVRIDGMGTSNRSKAFHDVAWQNIGDAGFPDRKLWIAAAAEKYPYLDLSRVGIYGGSAGGQNALRALLAHPEFYHVGVADCGCHDNRMDKVWWNELWMGWPIGEHYKEQSNVTNAHLLQGKLMLVVGELDRNVDPASTMQVANALVKADKDFDLLILPGVGHGAAETPYGSRRRMDFFVRHLYGFEPRRP